MVVTCRYCSLPKIQELIMLLSGPEGARSGFRLGHPDTPKRTAQLWTHKMMGHPNWIAIYKVALKKMVKVWVE